MLATHVNLHDLVIACTCPSALHSAASAFYPKCHMASCCTVEGNNTEQEQSTLTNHLATEAAVLKLSYFYILVEDLYTWIRTMQQFFRRPRDVMRCNSNPAGCASCEGSPTQRRRKVKKNISLLYLQSATLATTTFWKDYYYFINRWR